MSADYKKYLVDTDTSSNATDGSDRSEKHAAHPTSVKVTKAIDDLKKEKLGFIHKALEKSDFDKSSLWQIRKSEIGNVLGMSAQSLFNRSSYSPYLAGYLEDANGKLTQAMQKRVSALARGLQAQRKDKLIDDVQTLRKRINQLESERLSDVVESVIQRLTPDVRRRLGL